MPLTTAQLTVLTGFRSELYRGMRDDVERFNPAEFRYRHLQDLVSTEGEWARFAPGNFGGQRHGEFGFCFYNAAQLSVRYPDQLTYVEGFALIQGEVMHHAWVVDRAGWAYDPTWIHESPEVTAALGVRVPATALHWHWKLCGGASFLEDPYHTWPAQRFDAGAWETSLVPWLSRLYSTHCLTEVREGRATVRADGSIWHQEHLGPLSRQLNGQAPMRSDLRRLGY